MNFEEIKKTIQETGFSPKAEELVEQILKEAQIRGSLTSEDKAKLAAVIDADIFLDQAELEARKDLSLILAK